MSETVSSQAAALLTEIEETAASFELPEPPDEFWRAQSKLCAEPYNVS